MNDIYDHPDNRLIYVVENIPGPVEDSKEYTELLNNFNSQIDYKCECEGNCSEEQCPCIYNSRGKNYKFSNINDIKTYKLSCKNKNFEYMILECNDLCSCKSSCGNKLVGKGPCKDLIIRCCENKEKGVGLFTTHLITEGSFICEYAGELITKSQAFARHQSNMDNGRMNFIFCLNEHCNGKVIQTFVDPSNFGNIGRYINHSCNANSHILPVRINSPVPKLAIFSLCDILPNQEITIDYGSNKYDISQEIISNVEYKRKKCLCNNYKCKGDLPYDSY